MTFSFSKDFQFKGVPDAPPQITDESQEISTERFFKIAKGFGFSIINFSTLLG